MKRSAFVLFLMLLAAAALVNAQVVPSAYTRWKLSVTVGAMGSLFQPDYAGTLAFNGQNQYTPIAGTSPQWLFGAGAFLDVKMTRWAQLEAETRWLRQNQYQHIHEDNYLVGARVPWRAFRGFTPYGKALGGWANVPFGPGLAYHSYPDVALGGGVDYRLNKRFSVRAVDFEYQKLFNWPDIGPNQSISPYGVSVGLSYKIF